MLPFSFGLSWCNIRCSEHEILKRNNEHKHRIDRREGRGGDKIIELLDICTDQERFKHRWPAGDDAKTERREGRKEKWQLRPRSRPATTMTQTQTYEELKDINIWTDKHLSPSSSSSYILVFFIYFCFEYKTFKHISIFRKENPKIGLIWPELNLAVKISKETITERRERKKSFFHEREFWLGWFWNLFF